MVEFISYSGRYPCLCFGTLVIKVDGKEYSLDGGLRSGGSVWFDDGWSEHVESGEWRGISCLPEELKQYEDEILRVVNDNVSYGCCGGCV